MKNQMRRNSGRIGRKDRIELMRPEIKAMMNLSLEEKVKETEAIIKKSITDYRNVGAGFSGGSDSLAMVHMALKVKPDMPLLFVDTRYEFPETVGFIDRIRKEWNIASITTVQATSDKVEEFRTSFGFGTTEFTVNFNRHHKIDPLLKGIKLMNLDAFLGGSAEVEHEERAKESIFSPRPNLNPQHMRVHPILFWKREDVREYLDKNKLPHHPVYDRGFTSLGSTLDTSPNDISKMHERAGRGVARERAMQELRELGYN